ncbi:MAG: glycosyltransferase family 4 protein [Leptospira sp.]|nr:glycosyltransferase family 4 protein [Leptospira sp.]
MKLKNIHQFSAGFNPGDAISNEMVVLQAYFRKLGIRGNIYSENIGTLNTKISRKFKSYSGTSSDLVIYHHSIHSNVLDFILNVELPKILIYHNVTPSHFFEPYDLKLAYYLKKGREELSEIRDNFEICFADSAYNKEELVDLGYKNVHILPIVYDFSKLQRPGNSISNGSRKNILFVGRIAPNKKQDDLIRFAKIFRDISGDHFLLNIVGQCSREMHSYQEELEKMVGYYDLHDHVKFSSFLSDSDLNEYYKNADLFLSMSDHEGFCVPIIESMHFGVPIVAYNAGAVKDTLDGSGILFNKKDFVLLAGTVSAIFRDHELRKTMVSGQRKSLENFQNKKPALIIENEIRKKFSF